MFYRPEDGHGLPHNPFGAVIAPRPIGWISTRGADGADNLAPYSFFNAVAYEPPQVMFASTSAKADRGDTKDTVANIRDTGVFCVNMVGAEQQDVMNRTSGAWPRGVDEFSDAGIDRAECAVIPCARVAASPAALECRMTRIVPLEGAHNVVVFGQVVGVHLRDDLIREGRFDTVGANLLARLGYKDYTVVREGFELTRPGES
ncbi:flavin reductase family protein [Marivivens marinus]|uniref:flavin reductase family protein n=1 Tax=Marivivens marinus TaxID=3110173 RepID=UPI003B848695